MPEKQGSRIFIGARVLGYVSTHVPFVARFIKRRGETLLCTSVGKWIHTYGSKNLRLLSISGEHPGPITCMSGDNYHVYAASENDIYAWRRGCELKHVYKGHNAPIRFMLPFGIHLISVDTANVLKIFDIKEETQFLELVFDKKTFKITAICHPPTYLNKILLGSKQGQLQLWNLRTSKLVHTFNGWKSGVVLLEPAPAVDVVAIALWDGKIILHNLKFDETIVEFIHDWGAVSALSFRLDGVPMMVTGSINGHVVLWDLEERRAVSRVKSAHTSKIAGMKCLMSEPIMVTNADDNSLKFWIFDMSDGGARLLRKREGFAQPPNLVHYCEPNGTDILAAGRDSSLHIINTISETFNKNLGKASKDRKKSKRKGKNTIDTLLLPPIVGLSSCMQKDKRWDSIAALHRDRNLVTTWSFNRMCMGEHKLVPPGMDREVKATCLTVTHCGNFVVIGYTNGQVHKFNMQSGLHRGEYCVPNKGAHKGAVRGVDTDLLNHRVITAGADSKLKFWRFKIGNTPYHVLRLEESVSMTKCHRESALLAIAHEDFTITLVDIDSIATVRRFEGHTARITGIEFDVQSRWLISASMDCTVCTWDIPSSQLVDIFSVEEPCTSLSMSPTGNFLATTHVGEIGVFLWANKLLYEKIFLKPIDRSTVNVPKMDLPTTVPEKPSIEDIGVIDLGDETEYKSPEQISEELITLSNQPTSRWLNLLNLDIVKKRNKPKTPFTVPKSAPFFLPTIPSIDLEFDITGDKENENQDTKLLIPESFTTLTPFAKKLSKCKDVESFNSCIEKLKKLGPSAIEAEVSSMSPDVGGSFEVMKQFLLLIEVMLKSNRDLELAQSYLSLFLKTHTKVIAENEELTNTLVSVEESATEAWSKLQNHLLYNICVVKALKDMF